MSLKSLHTFTGEVRRLWTPYGSPLGKTPCWRLILRLDGFAPGTVDIEVDDVGETVAKIAMEAFDSGRPVAFDAETDYYCKLTEDDVRRNFRIVDRKSFKKAF